MNVRALEKLIWVLEVFSEKGYERLLHAPNWPKSVDVRSQQVDKCDNIVPRGTMTL